jgi:uncharacterized protein (DUF4415 family)
MAGRKRAKKVETAPAATVADLAREVAALEAWNAARRLRERGLPEGWDTLAWKLPARPARTPLTVTLDADLLAWFQALDPAAPLERLNAVLRIYMLGVQSREIDAP